MVFPFPSYQHCPAFVDGARRQPIAGECLSWTARKFFSITQLDQRWLKFAEIDYDDFRSVVAAGGTDDEIAAWIGEHAKKRPRAEIIAWNNGERDLHLSDLPLELQEYMEDYIQQFIPRNRVVYHWFDVYDLEEERI